MDYFKRLLDLLKIEKEEDRKSSEQLTDNMPLYGRRANGITWYPVAIKDTEPGRGDYLTVEVERTTHQDVIHQFRFGMSVALFSNHDAKKNRTEGIVSHLTGNRMKISLRVDELPDWSQDGKLGVDAVFDKNSYDEMENALRIAMGMDVEKNESHLVSVLTGTKQPIFNPNASSPILPGLNAMQQSAVQKILSASDLAIVHGPPGTGKTTTLVKAIRATIKQLHQKVLVVAPSNAAVDLLSEKLSGEGLNVVRVGNPARVNEQQMALTLDSKMAAHKSIKEIKALKKRASMFRDMAHKYKRSFGIAEREQRKALFAEARNIGKEVERTEQYMAGDVLAKADVITATLIGANHYSVRHLKYETVFIDEAGQALEPACWVAILKGKKLVMAGDHWQLSPTIKSAEAARKGLGETLMEKCVALHPEAVVLLEEQYRMHKTIMGFSSAEFYEGRLKAHPSVAEALLSEDDAPLAFIDTAGCGFDEKREGTSLSNPEEAGFLVKHLSGLVNQLRTIYSIKQFPSIGVISPYKHQVELLKELVSTVPGIKETQSAVGVNTIDSFQGQERDIIYISMTRSNAESNIGFLSDIRRMNVAMTRARKKLIVIGDSATLAQFDFYADFIRYSQDNKMYQSAWEFMDE